MKKAIPVEIDYLAYVRKCLNDSGSRINRTNLAAAAGITTRTLDNIKNQKADPAYCTVVKLYQLLKQHEAEQAAGGKK